MATNNTINTPKITLGGALTFTGGAFTFTGTLTGNTAVTFPTSGTLATTASASGIINSGTTNQLTYYASSGTTVSGLSGTSSAALTTTSAGVPTWVGLTNGQLVVGNTGGNPTAATLTQGSGVTITNGAGTITIATTASGMVWSTIAGTTQAAAVNNGYIVGNSSATTITLPSTAAVGDRVAVQGFGAAGWILQANTGQVVNVGQSPTSTAGSVTSAANFDAIEVVCLVANTTWGLRSLVTSGVTVA